MARQSTYYDLTVPEVGDSPDVSILATDIDRMTEIIHDHAADGARAAEAYLEDALADLNAAADAAMDAAFDAETAAGVVDQKLVPVIAADVTSVPYDPSSSTGGASVTRTGTTLQPTFHFSIPRGMDGPGSLYLESADTAQITTIRVVDGDDIDEAVDDAVARGIDDIVDAAVAEALSGENFVYQVGNMLYPVGSIYVSTSSVEPGTLFGGTWRRITGRFLLAATDGGATGDQILNTANVAAGNSGGYPTHTLIENEMPSHTHSPATGVDFLVFHGTGQGTSGAASGSIIKRTNIGTTGGGQPHNNMPPFLAVYVWERMALWVAPAPVGE